MNIAHGIYGSGLDSSEVKVCRLIAILCMVIVHLPLNDLYEQVEGTYWEYIYRIIVDGFARASSPLMGCFSAFFTFHIIKARTFTGVLLSRVKTLVIPAALWILIHYLVMALLGQSDAELSVFDLFGIDGRPPYNTPLHYIHDLFKLVIVFSLLDYLTKGRGFLFEIIFIILVTSFTVTTSVMDDPGNRTTALPRADLVAFFSLTYFSLRFSFFNKIIRIIKYSNPLAAFTLIGTLLVVGIFTYPALYFPEGSLIRDGVSYIAEIFKRLTAALLLLKLGIEICARGISIPTDKFAFSLFVTHAITFSILNKLFLDYMGISELGVVFISAIIIAFINKSFFKLTPSRLSSLFIPAK